MNHSERFYKFYSSNQGDFMGASRSNNVGDMSVMRFCIHVEALMVNSMAGTFHAHTGKAPLS